MEPVTLTAVVSAAATPVVHWCQLNVKASLELAFRLPRWECLSLRLRLSYWRQSH
ncbi:MAG: hypothetical protein V7K90_25990 [Nostoc sp.]|uniref:hypothetical protein n=1 Tax=Nostoc sp. TaxID=1180 RepID=UPI002FF63742